MLKHTKQKEAKGQKKMTTLIAAISLTVATLGFLTIRELGEISVTSTIIKCLPNPPSLCSSDS